MPCTYPAQLSYSSRKLSSSMKLWTDTLHITLNIYASYTSRSKSMLKAY